MVIIQFKSAEGTIEKLQSLDDKGTGRVFHEVKFLKKINRQNLRLKVGIKNITTSIIFLINFRLRRLTCEVPNKAFQALLSLINGDANSK